MSYTRSFQFTAAVRGYHVYRTIWNPEINEKLICNFEPGNEFDMFAIQACILRDHVQVTVGHLPREISRPTKFLLDRGAEVTASLIGTHYRRSPLIQGGLEIPCIVTVTISGNALGHLLMVRYEEMVGNLYCEPNDIVVMGTYLEKDEVDVQPVQQPRKIAPRKPVQNKNNSSGKNQDIRVLFASNRNPPRCKESSSSTSKVIILDE